MSAWYIISSHGCRAVIGASQPRCCICNQNDAQMGDPPIHVQPHFMMRLGSTHERKGTSWSEITDRTARFGLLASPCRQQQLVTSGLVTEQQSLSVWLQGDTVM